MTEAQRTFLARVKAAAPLAEAQDVPAAVMVAQSVIESGWGRSGLTKLGNALFGIKARTGWPGSVYSGTTAEVVAGRYVRYRGTNKLYPTRAVALADGASPVTIFRAYRSFENSIVDHAQFFHDNRRYHGCLDAYAARKDPFEFAACIHRAGYATSLTYTQTISAAMRQFAPEFLPVAAEEPSLLRRAIRVLLDGEEVPAELVDGKVFIHVRMLERVGKAVRWNSQTRTVEVT